MTNEEMNDMIQEYCDGNCWNCDISNECDDVLGDFLKYPEQLLIAYNKLLKTYIGHEDSRKENTEDVVNHPKHYNREGGMECIDEMLLIFGKSAVMAYCLLNAWKYRYRASSKNGEEDLHKSDWYIKKYKELKEEADNE